jgi:hypothetical protein
MLTSRWHLIPPLIYMYSEDRVHPLSDLYFLLDLWDWLLFVIFLISHKIFFFMIKWLWIFFYFILFLFIYIFFFFFFAFRVIYKNWRTDKDKYKFLHCIYIFSVLLTKQISIKQLQIVSSLKRQLQQASKFLLVELAKNKQHLCAFGSEINVSRFFQQFW